VQRVRPLGQQEVYVSQRRPQRLDVLQQVRAQRLEHAVAEPQQLLLAEERRELGREEERWQHEREDLVLGAHVQGGLEALEQRRGLAVWLELAVVQHVEDSVDARDIGVARHDEIAGSQIAAQRPDLPHLIAERFEVKFRRLIAERPERALRGALKR